MKRIRILLTIPHLTSTASPYREMMTIAELLPRDEFDLTICSLRANGYDETQPRLQALGVQCFVARFRPRGRGLSKIIDALQDQSTINQYGPFDIQHAWDFSASPFEALAARFYGRRFIHVQRNMNENSSKLLLQIRTRLASKIHANAEATKQLLLSYGVKSSKIKKIYNGLDLDQIPRRGLRVNSDKNRYILFVGHLQPRKRQEDAIKAIAKIAYAHPNVCLKLVGSSHDSEYHNKLVQLADELKIKEKVEFLGTRDDVLELMQGAEAVMLCSEREALSWVIVEAMAVGLPVIASAVDGSLEAIEHNKTGLLIPVGDIDGYADALQRLLTQPHFSEEISANARKKVEQDFSAQRMVEHVADLYREVAG